MRGTRPVLFVAVVLGVAAITATVIDTELGGSTGAKPATPAGAARVAASSTKGTVEVLHTSVAGVSGSTRDVWVYRPPVPDTKDLPVLYFLHGVPSSPKEVFDAGLAQLMDDFFASGHTPFVLAVPDGRGTRHADTEWADAADGSDKMETFVTRDVIRVVEGRNRRDRSHRAIGGFSMGGYGAVNLGFRHPDLYDQIVSLAGYFHVDDPDHVFGRKTATIEANTPELHVADARRHRMFIVDGEQDDDRVVKGEARQFASQLLAAHVPAWYEQVPGGHTYQFVASVFDDVMTFLDARWSTLRPPPPTLAGAGSQGAHGEWRAGVARADVDVELPAPGDARVHALESLRRAAGARAVSYMIVTVSNPSSASRPVNLTKVSFVDDEGTTIDANPADATVKSWTTIANGRSGASAADTTTSGAGGSGRQSSAARRRELAALLRAADALMPQLRDPPVAPGRTVRLLLVTTSVVSSVDEVFVGDSFEDHVLARVG